MNRRVLFVIFFVAFMHSACTAQDSTVPQTARDFRSRERQIAANTQEAYREAREVLAEEALSAAEQSLGSKTSEELLHWIVKGGNNSKSAHKATDLLIAHHASSPASIRKLLSYAINPTGCTPKLFAGFECASPGEEEHWIVLASSAIHEKSLLFIADELLASSNEASQYRTRLGSELATHLVKRDPNKIEAQLMADFRDLAKQYGDKTIGGMSIKELAEGSIFALQNLRLGKVAKGLSGKTLGGNTVKIENFRGKILLIDFWATWCAPCATAVPELVNLSREFPSSKFEILGVSADQDHEQLKDFIEKQSVTWDNIVDSDGVLQKRWQNLSLPSYYVLDENGVIRFRGTDHSGAINAVRSIMSETSSGILSTPPIEEIAKSILATYDKDKDGRLEKTELPEEGQANFEKADMNKDEALSMDEIIKLLQTAEVTSRAVEIKPPTQERDRARR